MNYGDWVDRVVRFRERRVRDSRLGTWGVLDSVGGELELCMRRAGCATLAGIVNYTFEEYVLEGCIRGKEVV